MLSVSGLGLERGGRWLFRDLSFVLSPGELLEVRGANGSGKTSLLKLLAGVLHPSEQSPGAQMQWQGQPLRAAALNQPLIGWMGHRPALLGGASALDNLRLESAADLPALMEKLNWAGLGGYALADVNRLSEGQRRRLALLRLHLGAAPLWLLDEPLTALDERARGWLDALLAGHAERGGCALIASHSPVCPTRSRALELTIGAAP